MMILRTVLLSLIIACSTELYGVNLISSNEVGECVLCTKKINIPGYPDAFNPSITNSPWGILLTFRSVPHLQHAPWISELGIVILDEHLEIASAPQLLCTRSDSCTIAQQSEDVRIFQLNGKIYLSYNDSMEITDPKPNEHRDIYLAELVYENHSFTVKQPIKLFHKEKYKTQKWQKNWVPFEWNGLLLMGYTVNPHEIICPNLDSGSCQPVWSTRSLFKWNLGPLRGGTPAQLVDGEYLAFFHSSCTISSDASEGKQMWHYFMGAYTFSRDPPFNLTKVTLAPLVAANFYTPSAIEKRVIFPGGYIINDPLIHVAYGKDDHEVWITTIDKQLLMKHLLSIMPFHAPLSQSIK